MGARVVIAKTGLDGHWRGVNVVAHALRDAGFEVILLGEARADEIVAAAESEDADLVGLNVGGRIEIVERILHALGSSMPDVPVMAGGTLPPSAIARLEELGVPAFPPGSPLSSIVDTARRLTAPRAKEDAHDR